MFIPLVKYIYTYIEVLKVMRGFINTLNEALKIKVPMAR